MAESTSRTAIPPEPETAPEAERERPPEAERERPPEEEMVELELLVEEVSIDGMCGVY